MRDPCEIYARSSSACGGGVQTGAMMGASSSAASRSNLSVIALEIHCELEIPSSLHARRIRSCRPATVRGAVLGTIPGAVMGTVPCATGVRSSELLTLRGAVLGTTPGAVMGSGVRSSEL